MNHTNKDIVIEIKKLFDDLCKNYDEIIEI
jgi:hypothetical protein